MRLPLRRKLALISALAACVMPLMAAAQPVGDGADGGDAPQAGPEPKDEGGVAKSGGGARVKYTTVTPYIEARQVVTADITPGNDVLTYSSLAAGVDASVVGLRNAGSVSVRYERMFGWGREASDGDIISGVARGYATVVPGLQIEAGGLATRSHADGGGTGSVGGLIDSDSSTRVYSVYAGPSFATRAGPVDVNAGYRLGYTRVDRPDTFVTAPEQSGADVFDDSVVQSAEVHAGVQPYEILPVGLGGGASYYREDISNLDQRVEDFQARADITVPVSYAVALVGGIGYEDVEISSRDVLRDSADNPVIGRDGRYVTDKSVPRILAYDVSGLIWDAGVMWRPSRRTALEAHVGRRYGSTGVYGSFGYAPTSRSSLNIAVYNNIAGFGGQVNRALVDLPTEFTAVRDPLSGDISGCVSALESGSCLTGALGSLRSATFRARGVTASYSVKINRIGAGIGAGYDRRKFIAAPGTILAIANGVVDENYWLSAYLNGEIDVRSGFSTNLYANWFETGSGFGGDATVLGASATYYRNLTDRLTASAALGISGLNRDEPLDDSWGASAQLGVRYNF